MNALAPRRAKMPLLYAQSSFRGKSCRSAGIAVRMRPQSMTMDPIGSRAKTHSPRNRESRPSEARVAVVVSVMCVGSLSRVDQESIATASHSRPDRLARFRVGEAPSELDRNRARQDVRPPGIVRRHGLSRQGIPHTSSKCQRVGGGFPRQPLAGARPCNEWRLLAGTHSLAHSSW